MAEETKRKKRDREALRRLFDDKRHHGGRLPDITQPTLVEQSPPLDLMQTSTIPIGDPQGVVPGSGKRGARLDKPTGLQLQLFNIQQNGWTSPTRDGGFLMTPREFKALLALETMAVIQVVYEVLDQTIGWVDPRGPGGRKEWVTLSPMYFVRAGLMSRSQAQKGLKIGVEKNYLRRQPNPKGLGFQYAMRWKGADQDC